MHWLYRECPARSNAFKTEFTLLHHTIYWGDYANSARPHLIRNKLTLKKYNKYEEGTVSVALFQSSFYVDGCFAVMDKIESDTIFDFFQIFYFQIYLRLFIKIWNGSNRVYRAMGEIICEKTRCWKSCHTLFESVAKRGSH